MMLNEPEDDATKKAAAIPTAVNEMQAISIFSASAKVRAAAAVVVLAKGSAASAGAGKGDSGDHLRVLCALTITQWKCGKWG